MRREITHTKHQVMVLRGREFAEPPEPRELKAVGTAIRDRGDARQFGRGKAVGFEMTNEDGGPHIDDKIEADVAAVVADQQQQYALRVEAAEGVARDAVEQESHARREIEILDEERGELQAVRRELGDRHGPGPVGYGLLLLTVFLLNLPVDMGAARLLPLAPAMRTLLAVLLGAGTTWMAHYAARKIEDLREAHVSKDADPYAYAQERLLLAASLAVPILVIIGTTIWRGQAFAGAEKATGGLVQGGAANLAFAAIALLAFAVAVIAGLAHRRMLPLRDVRKKLRVNAGKRRVEQDLCDRAERLQRQAEVTMAFLEERVGRRIERIEQWGAKRKATVRQRAANVEMRRRLNHPEAADGLRDAHHPDVRAGYKHAAKRPIDVEGVVRDIERRANGAH